MKPYFDHPVLSRSITALACSILAAYGQPVLNPTLKEADRLLRKRPRNVVLLLLDGLGYNILHRHLPASSFMRRHSAGAISSVFPPTTAAAATALESGLFPSQSGWLGWSVYWPELKNNVALYPNTTPDGAQAASEHLGECCLSFPSMVQQIGRAGIQASARSAQRDTVGPLFSQIEALCRQPGEHFIYGYLNEPDSLLHKHGCQAAEVSAFLRSWDRQLGATFSRWPDCLLFLTADHGFTNLEGICLEDFPALADTLLIPPSIEPRALNCFVKPGLGLQFQAQLNQIVGDSYEIYTRQEVEAKSLFGPPPNHPRFHSMLGSYLAVAHTPLTLFPTRGYLTSMVAGHGGMTPEELTVPLIAALSS